MCSGLCFHLTLKKTSTNLSENVYNLGGTNLVTAARQTKTTQLESFPAYFTPTEDMGPPKCWAEGLSGSWQAWGGTISAVGWSDIALSFDFQNYFYESNSKKLAYAR